ncbi:hypothetical protein J4401_00475 [Candidatus Woesearchaeota archaeon]|nr:hypothetical protein [Candidatus Woesearchaeota archaeon]
MKKGDLSINMIIMIVLGLIVLIILIAVFKEQITKGAEAFLGIGKDAKDGAEGKKCMTFAATRKCVSSGNPPKCDEGWREYPPGQDKFTDCTRGICCEKW